VAVLQGCPRPVTTGEVGGTITVHGYDIDPAYIQIQARPILSDSGASGKAGATDRSFVVSAARLRGGDASQFEFRLSGIALDVPYRIGVRIDNQDAYPRLAWSANHDPLVLAGDSSLMFDAYAVRSEIEVMNSDQDRDQPAWVAADALDFSDPAQAARTFRWRSTLADVTGGQLQISLEPFPRIARQGYAPCANGDEGIIYKQDFDADVASGQWVTLPSVDFNVLLQGRRAGSKGDKDLLRGAVGKAVDDPNWATLTLPKLEAGHPLYVRVMPKIGEELVCEPNKGGVPPEVLLARISPILFEIKPAPLSKVSVGQVWYTKPDYGAHPYKGETCYRVTKDHVLFNFIGAPWDTIVHNFTGVPFGAKATRNMTFCLPPPKGGGGGNFLENFVNSFGSVLTGAFGAFADVVNYASKLWEEIQDAVVDVAASAVDEVGIVDCGKGSTCRGALETGLEIGLAAMGVPPSLPNFDELMDQGLDYLAAEVASQTGVPQVLVDYASQEAKDFVKSVAEKMKTNYAVSGLPDWIAPDIQFDPAYLTVELYGPGKSHPFYYSPNFVLTNSLGNFQHIYRSQIDTLPIQLPKQGVEPPILYPMVLQADMTGLPPAPSTTIQALGGPITIAPSPYEKAVWNKNQWIANRYGAPFSCYGWSLYAISNHPDQGSLGNQGYFVFEAEFSPFDASLPCGVAPL
jgi:hypothetical protein